MSRPEQLSDINLEKQEKVNALKKLVEGEVMGSNKSKAFCDYIDYRIADYKLQLSVGDNRRLETKLLLIEDRIESRSNELPDYADFKHKTAYLVNKLTETIYKSYKNTPSWGDERMTHEFIDVLSNVKADHLKAANSGAVNSYIKGLI